MTRYLIFPSAPDAQAVVDLIDDRARAVFASRGWVIDSEGNIVGKRPADRLDLPTATRTRTWWEPLKRPTDNKWIVLHPENHPSLMAEPALIPLLMQGLGSAVIETDTGSWFPRPSL